MIKKLSLISVCFLSIPLCAMAQPRTASTADQVETYMERGLDNLGRDCHAAVVAFTEALNLNRQNARAYLLRAEAYECEGESYPHRTGEANDSAIADYAKVIELNPEDPAAYRSRARLSCEKENYDLAIADLSKALSLAIDSQRPLNQLGLAESQELLLSQRGYAYLDAYRFDDAIRDFSQGIKLFPPSHLFWRYDLALAYYLKKDYGAALAQIATPLAADAKYSDFYFLRSEAYRALGKYDLADADIAKGEALTNRDSFAGGTVSKKAKKYFDLGERYRGVSSYQAAIAEYTKAIAVDPQYIRAYSIRADSYFRMKSYDAGAADCALLMRIDPQNASSYLWLRGEAYRDQEKYDAAITDFTRAIQINPKLTSAYLSRAGVYAAQKRYETALADVEKLIQLEPKNADWYSARSELYDALGKKDLSAADKQKANDLKAVDDLEIRHYTEEIASHPDNGDAYIDRGAAYLKNEAYDAAIADFAKAIQLQPKTARAYLGRGVAYSGKRNYAAALADYDKAIQLDPRMSDAYEYRGSIYREQGTLNAAITDFTKALELSPTSKTALFERAGTYFELKQYELAAADLTKSIQLDPRNADCYSARAQVYRKMGKNDLAAADEQRAKEVSPN